MAQIKEYDSPNAAGGLKISNLAESSAESVASNAQNQGNRIKASYDSLASEARSTAGVVASTATSAYDKYIVQPQLSQLTTLYAGATDDLTQKWNKIAATSDPNDASIKQKFMDEEFQPAMDKIAGGTTTGEGQKFAEDQSNALLKHFNEKTTADMSTRTGEALKINLDQTKNSYSNAARSDPSSADHSMEAWKASVHVQVNAAAANGFLTPAQAAAAEGSITEHGIQEIAHAAILGTALKNPDTAIKLLESGKYDKYVDGVQMQQMIKSIKSFNRIDENHNRVTADRAAQEKSDNTVLDYEKRMRTDPQSVTAIGALQDQNLTRTDAVMIAKTIDRENKPETEAKVSHINSQQIYGDILNGKVTDINDIRRAYVNGQINRADRDDLINTYTQARDEQGTKLGTAKDSLRTAVSGLIDKSNPLMGPAGIDQNGKLQLYNFQHEMDAKIEEYRKTGKNIYDLFDPDNPNFLGRPAYISKFQRTLADSVRDQAMKLTRGAISGNISDSPPGAPVRTEGSTPVLGAPEKYPDARQNSSGEWIVIRDGKAYKVKQ